MRCEFFVKGKSIKEIVRDLVVGEDANGARMGPASASLRSARQNAASIGPGEAMILTGTAFDAGVFERMS